MPFYGYCTAPAGNAPSPPETMEWTVTDALDRRASATVTVTVTCPPAPVAESSSYEASALVAPAPIALTLLSSGSSNLFVYIDTPPRLGALSATGGTQRTYTPKAGKCYDPGNAFFGCFV